MKLQRSPIALALGLAAVAALLPPKARAQATPEEAAAVLLDAARTLSGDGQTDAARAIYQLILRRYPSTEAAEAAREALDATAPSPTAGDGRTELMVWATTYGLFLGVAIPTALGADDSAPYGVGLLLGGPGGFLAGRAIAGSREITVGQARAVTFAGTWGTWQGLAWQDLLDIGEAPEICDAFGCYSEDNIEETFAAMAIGGLVGVAVGTGLSHRDITSGDASAVNFSALWGTWFGFATGVLLDLEGDGLLASTVVGGDAALLLAATMAPRWNVSRNRARLISISGVVGLLAGAGLDLIVEPESDKAAIALPLAASLIGLSFGAAATRETASAGPGDDDAPGGGALFSWDGRGLRLDAPLPYPVLRSAPVGRGGREARRLGLGLTLLSARF